MNDDREHEKVDADTTTAATAAGASTGSGRQVGGEALAALLEENADTIIELLESALCVVEEEQDGAAKLLEVFEAAMAQATADPASPGDAAGATGSRTTHRDGAADHNEMRERVRGDAARVLEQCRVACRALAEVHRSAGFLGSWAMFEEQVGVGDMYAFAEMGVAEGCGVPVDGASGTDLCDVVLGGRGALATALAGSGCVAGILGIATEEEVQVGTGERTWADVVGRHVRLSRVLGRCASEAPLQRMLELVPAEDPSQEDGASLRLTRDILCLLCDLAMRIAMCSGLGMVHAVADIQGVPEPARDVRLAMWGTAPPSPSSDDAPNASLGGWCTLL